MKVKYNHWFAKILPGKEGWAYGKAMFGNIYFSEDKATMLEKYPSLMRHELTHIYQQEANEYFWVDYAWQWFANTIKLNGNFHQAYLDIDYEVLARESEKFPLTKEELKQF